MTLVLTAIDPNVGAWQVTDQDVSVGERIIDRDWTKQVVIFCTDGSMLLAYNGLARTPGGESIGEWICRQVAPLGAASAEAGYQAPSAWIGVEYTLTLLRDAATRDFSRGPMPYRQTPLIISGCLLHPPRDVYYIGITNVRSGGVADAFYFSSTLVTQPTLFGTGSGAAYITVDERVRIANIIANRPRRESDYFKLLAQQNERVAKRVVSGVSPWCQCVFMPLDSYPLRGKSFVPRGLRKTRVFRRVRFVNNGLDMTPIADAQMARIIAENPQRSWMNDDWVIGPGLT